MSITNITYSSNFSTNLSCGYMGNVNVCYGQIAVVPIHQDIVITLLTYILICLAVIAFLSLFRLVIGK
jgi:hypothetical protein